MKHPLIWTAAVGFVAYALFVAVLFVLADTEELDVTSCTASGCSTTNYNANDTTIGATVAKSGTDTLGWSDSAVTASDTIHAVYLHVRHDGDAGISGNTDITYQSVGGGTEYCTDSFANNANPDYDVMNTSGCGWTAARLDDLEVVLRNGDGSGPTDNNYLYADIFIDYTVSAGPDCSIDCSTNPTTSSDLDCSGENLTATGTGTWRVEANVTFGTLYKEDGCTIYMPDDAAAGFGQA